MNHYPPATTAGNAVDAVNSRVFLQQTIDHYPRLAAFSFTLVLPYRDTLADYHELILRFHTDVWQCIGEYSRQRQQARQNPPPTLLRWRWETACVPECRMVLLMNFDTLEAGPIRLPFDGMLCAAAGQAAYFDQAPLGVTKESQR